jgi:metal-responsive CopG/Arc/MetJ family transcriptional regulator
MRTTGTVTVSLPPEPEVEVDSLAHQGGRTRSELLREAFRQNAERRRRWDQSLRMETNERCRRPD